MPDLTREQLEALASGEAMHAASADVTWMPPNARGFQDEVRVIGYSDELVRALATEVLAQRERYQDLREWVMTAQMGIDQEDEGAVYEAVAAAMRTHCADWRAKETK